MRADQRNTGPGILRGTGGANGSPRNSPPPLPKLKYPVITQLALVTASISLALLIGLAGLPGEEPRVAGEGSQSLRQGWAANLAADHDAATAPESTVPQSAETLSAQPEPEASEGTDDSLPLEHPPSKR